MGVKDDVYKRLIVKNLNDEDVGEVLTQRLYVKPEIKDYLIKNKILPFNHFVSNEEAEVLKSVGWCSEVDFTLSGRVVIPIRDAQGNILTLVGWRKGKSKYYTIASEDFSKESHWFNIDNALKKASQDGVWKNRCVVVEGIFDALMLDCMGIPCVATMGATVNAFKGAMLGFFDKVVCIPDGDVVGQKAIQKWKVPSNATFLSIQPSKIKVGEDLSLTLKDMDDIVKIYPFEEISKVIQDAFESYERVINFEV